MALIDRAVGGAQAHARMRLANILHIDERMGGSAMIGSGLPAPNGPARAIIVD